MNQYRIKETILMNGQSVFSIEKLDTLKMACGWVSIKEGYTDLERTKLILDEIRGLEIVEIKYHE